MNQPKDKTRQLAIAVPTQSNPFIIAMQTVGLLPTNCRRFVIDSGPPDGVMRIYFDCFLDDRLLEAPVIRSLSQLKPLKKQK
jgi:hypothetical protein